MAAPTTGRAFLDLLRRSNLLPDARLADYLAKLPDADKMTPTDLAGRMVRDELLTRFQATHLIRGRYKNFFLGKLKILEPLGTGGMSQVFLCEHTVMKHRVATKMLPVREGTDPSVVTRFLREARAAAAVNHPNVVRAHDFDVAEGKYYYLVMDYIDGVNLHDLVKTVGPLPPAHAAHYAAQTAAGLQHIAECGLIHRDIKPSNLLLDRGGTVKILDLGLARFTADDQDNVTRQMSGHAVLGTADYLSPEQALMSDRLDVRSDLYSLGATLYFLLAGTAPFEVASVAQKLLAHQLREPEPIPDIPAALQAVVRRMMRKDPGDRYQTPADVIDALAPWLADDLPPPDAAWFPRPSERRGSPPPSSRPVPRTAARPAAVPPRTGPLPPPGPGSDVLRSSVLPKFDLPPDPPKWSKTWVVVGAAAAVALAAAVVIFVVANPFRKEPPPRVATPPPPGPAAPGPRELPGLPAGSLVVSAAGPLRTVSDALRQVRPGGRIVLTDPEHVENLIVESPPADVTVQGWPEDRPVRWAAAGDGPLVGVADAVGFALTNVALDGGGTADVLVALSGACPGTRVENVTARGFRDTAVHLTGCRGEPGREVRLERVKVVGGGGGTGVRVTGGEHVRVSRCRFDGPLADGVAVVGPADAVGVSSCRFHEAGSGVRVAGGGVVRLALTNNVFAAVGAGLAADARPPAGSTFDVTNNLFVRVPKLATCEGVTGVPAFPLPPWVWHDEGLPADRAANVPAGTRYFRKAFDLPAPPAAARLDVGCVTAFKVWVNGTFVGESNPKHFTRRVYAFPVGKLLKPGANAIAVEATHTRDPIDPTQATPAGLTVRLAEPKADPIVVTDPSWVSAATAGTGWQAVGFAAGGWKPVKVWPRQGARLPWEGSAWDAAVAEQLGGGPPFPVTAAGNVRDYNSGEGYPLLDSVRGYIPRLAGADPADDATFLRTPPGNPRLAAVGVPVGR